MKRVQLCHFLLHIAKSCSWKNLLAGWVFHFQKLKIPSL